MVDKRILQDFHPRNWGFTSQINGSIYFICNYRKRPKYVTKIAFMQNNNAVALCHKPVMLTTTRMTLCR